MIQFPMAVSKKLTQWSTEWESFCLQPLLLCTYYIKPLFLFIVTFRAEFIALQPISGIKQTSLVELAQSKRNPQMQFSGLFLPQQRLMDTYQQQFHLSTSSLSLFQSFFLKGSESRRKTGTGGTLTSLVSLLGLLNCEYILITDSQELPLSCEEHTRIYRKPCRGQPVP